MNEKEVSDGIRPVHSLTVVILRADAPQLDDDAATALQNAMAHLADLHEAGHLLAVDPLDDEEFRGLSILNVEPEYGPAS